MDNCNVLNCGRLVFASGLCRTHHRWWKAGKRLDGEPRVAKYTGPCIIEGCLRKPRSRKMCTIHYSLWRRLKDIDAVANYQQPIESMDANGYIVANVCHPENSTGRSILKHRMIMMNYLGRELVAGETVHHKNGDRSDNRLENLELWSTSQPSGQRVQDKLAWAREIIELYGGREWN
jgi:hypothetical protein